MSIHPSPGPYKALAEEGAHNPKASHRRSRVSKRAERPKRDSGHYLTYYQSSLADGRSDTSDSIHHIKHLSVDSTSSSEYSSDSNSTNSKLTDVPRARMRSGVPSDGGSDRRRMAIVEVDVESNESSQRHRRGSIRTRRGLHSSLAGLALVAPPDAAPKSYCNLTPPFTAPPSADTMIGDQKRSASRERTCRTASNSPSRQPRIFVEDNTISQPTALYHSVPRHQRPSSPSDGSDRHLLPQHTRTPAGREPLIKTPDIGEEKDIFIRVAAPVVINLESAEAIRRGKSPTRKQMTSHPTTAPDQIPQPPRAVFGLPKSPAPPRPPRLHSPISARTRTELEAVKQALQLPPSVTAAFAVTGPNTVPDKLPELEGKTLDEDTGICPGLNHVKSIHRREGAGRVSKTTISDSETSVSSTIPTTNVAASEDGETTFNDAARAANHMVPDSEDDVPDITVVRPFKYNGHPRRNESESDGTSSAFYKRGTLERIPSEDDTWAESRNLPAKISTTIFDKDLKRFSTLPQPPSSISRTPSPSPNPVALPRPKIKSLNPPAMFCAEITSRKSALERCMLYAQKINELYVYDSGLGDWTIETGHRANANRPTIAMSTHTIIPQPRHTSAGSIVSEATFPIRPDAAVATDLSVRTQDLIPVAPVNLPYPSLANQFLFPPRSSSVAGQSSSPSTKTGGFFSSLGRKASLSKKERATPLSPSNSSSGAKLVKGPPPQRVINMSSTPSVPGGPRAAPHHRMLRSKTLLPPTTKRQLTERYDAVIRRPSSSDISHPPPPLDTSWDPTFALQVDKLADLLPQADRDVLAGYLRRSGQDILAIGQYLEDEKNGTLRS